MPRRPRLHVPGGCYHVILRGNHREPLFGPARDRAYLNALVGDVVARFDLRIFAYCWMTNHLHLAVRVGETPLAAPMQRLAMRYSRHIHRDAGQVGHLFERRYWAILVDADRYLKSLVRYIHLNPVVAGMVGEPLAYPWSSHRDYLGRATVPWVDTDFVLAMFGLTAEVARSRYQRFLNGYAEDDRILFRKAETRDARVLMPDLPRPVPAPPPTLRTHESLEQIARRHCRQSGLALDELVSSSRARRLSKVRTAIAREALAGGAANLTRTAAFLGRSASALAQCLRRDHGAGAGKRITKESR